MLQPAKTNNDAHSATNFRELRRENETTNTKIVYSNVRVRVPSLLLLYGVVEKEGRRLTRYYLLDLCLFAMCVPRVVRDVCKDVRYRFC